MGQSGLMDGALRSALRKASWRLLPLVALGYGIAYIDRVNLSYAKLQMNGDLHFSETIYGLGAGLFFLSYAACEIPSNLLLYRLGARRWLSRIMISWGVVAMAMIFVRTPLEFYAARFLLGVAEAGFFPGIMYYIFLWFPDELRARAVTRFYIAFPLSTVVMGSLAGALMGLDGHAGLRGWQWLFLVEAAPAVVLGMVFYLLLPDGPADAPWLTESERGVVLAAVETNARRLNANGLLLRDAMRDSRVWLIGCFFMCAQTAGYGYIFSAPSIVQRLTGGSINLTGVVLAVIGVLGAIAMLAAGWLSDRAGKRHSYVMPWCVVMLMGYIVCGLAHSRAIALPALAAVFMGYAAIQGPLWAIPPTFLSGRSSAAGIATINMLGILGGFFGPYWMGYAYDWTGDYQRGLLTTTVPLTAAILILVRLGRLERAGISSASISDAVASKP